MKPQTPLVRRVLVIALAVALFPAVLWAQGYPMQPPVLPTPRIAPIGRSMAYFDAGVKWRHLYKLRFERKAHTVAGLGFTGAVMDESETNFSEDAWMPTVEYGRQYGNFFGLLLGASGFGISETESTVLLSVMSSGDTFTEILTQKVDLTTIEFKVAGRSWFPMFRNGTIGVSFGGLFGLTPYRFKTTSLAVADGRTTVALPAGTVIQNVEHKAEECHFDIGLFCGGDLEVGTDRFFLRGEVEYDYYFTTLTYRKGIAELHYNPSGLALSILGGIRF